jgi:glucose/arabinose dehydrogenase
VLAAALAVASCGGGDSPKRGGLVPIGAGLSGPAGYTASVYATGLKTVSAFALDPRGRLWVSTSGATRHTGDAVYLVARAGARPVRVIRDVRGPLGLTWSAGRLYVTSMGRVDAFGGLRGTRFTTHATILTEPSRHGWNNAIVRAPDGRMVMSISSACDHCTPTSKWSASIVSFRPDGSDVRVYARHIRAAFGLAYYRGRLLATMNQRDDLGARTPGDWLALVRRGDNWRFPQCYGQGGPACAGVRQPIAVLNKHAAAGGVAVLGDTALVPEWAYGKVLRVALVPTGGAAQPFLTGLRNPLPIVATRGGAVLVGDWGTGRIYRLSST